MKKISLIIILFVAASISKLTAQENLFSIQYSVGFGVSDMKDFIGKTSWRGATLDYRHMTDEGIGVGMSIGWNAFYEEPGYVTVVDGTQSLSGTQYRYCSNVPILASLDYYLKPGEKINPFAGVGIGTQYSRSDVDMGLYYYQVDTWHFALQPELGVIVSPNPGFGIMVAGKYYQAFKTKELDASRSYFALNVGFVWQY